MFSKTWNEGFFSSACTILFEHLFLDSQEIHKISLILSNTSLPDLLPLLFTFPFEAQVLLYSSSTLLLIAYTNSSTSWLNSQIRCRHLIRGIFFFFFPLPFSDGKLSDFILPQDSSRQFGLVCLEILTPKNECSFTTMFQPPKYK